MGHGYLGNVYDRMCHIYIKNHEDVTLRIFVILRIVCSHTYKDLLILINSSGAEAGGMGYISPPPNN